MDSVKTDAFATWPGKTPASVPQETRRGDFETAVRRARPDPATAGQRPDLAHLQAGSPLARPLRAPPAVQSGLLPSAAVGYGAARAAFGGDTE